MQKDEAEVIGARVLAFLAQDPERLGQFLALSGFGPAEIRAHAADPAFLAGVLDYLLGDEAAVLAFADWADLPPEAPMRARHLLPGGGHDQCCH